MPPECRCESDNGSSKGLGVASDSSDGGGPGEASDSPDRAGDGKASDGVRDPSVRDVDGLINLRKRINRPSMLDSNFRFDMVDEAFARRR